MGRPSNQYPSEINAMMTYIFEIQYLESHLAPTAVIKYEQKNGAEKDQTRAKKLKNTSREQLNNHRSNTVHNA